MYTSEWSLSSCKNFKWKDLRGFRLYVFGSLKGLGPFLEPYNFMIIIMNINKMKPNTAKTMFLNIPAGIGVKVLRCKYLCIEYTLVHDYCLVIALSSHPVRNIPASCLNGYIICKRARDLIQSYGPLHTVRKLKIVWYIAGVEFQVCLRGGGFRP